MGESKCIWVLYKTHTAWFEILVEISKCPSIHDLYLCRLSFEGRVGAEANLIGREVGYTSVSQGQTYTDKQPFTYCSFTVNEQCVYIVIFDCYQLFKALPSTSHLPPIHTLSHTAGTSTRGTLGFSVLLKDTCEDWGLKLPVPLSLVGRPTHLPVPVQKHHLASPVLPLHWNILSVSTTHKVRGSFWMSLFPQLDSEGWYLY